MGCSQGKVQPICSNRLRTNSEQSSTRDDENDGSLLIVRAVVLGDASVGKSSLSARYFKDEFQDVYSVTFGGVFFKKEIKASKELTLSLQMWDTGGEQKYRSIAPLYYRNASIAFLVCSLTDQNPTSSLQYWIEQLSQKASKEHMTIVILGNKSDLPRHEGAHPIEAWCAQNKVEYFQCSAKTGRGVKEAFARGLQLHLAQLNKVQI